MKSTLTFVILFLTTHNYSQLIGNCLIPANTYLTIVFAITTLGTLDVGAVDITVDFIAGYTETITTSNAGKIDSHTDKAAIPIIIQKTGVGANPKIKAEDMR
jgi:hypothetical protein